VIFKLPKLVEVGITHVQMAGTLSNAVTMRLAKLKVVNLSNNLLSGELKWDWGEFSL